MRPLVTAALLGLSVVPASVAFGDVVELKTGQRIEGTLKQADQANVAIEVGGQTVMFKADQVRAIYYGASPASQPPTPAAPSARDEALRALKALRSVAEGSTTYRDYTPRVSDTKIIVDRYLQEPERSDAELKAAMAEALHFYQLAGTAWEMEITLKEEPTRRVAADPAVARCPAAQSLIDDYRRRDPSIWRGGAGRGWTEAYNAAIALRIVKSGPRPFWTCAGDKLAEAEKLVQGQVR